MKKRTIAVMLASIILTLTACGSSETAQTNSNDNSSKAVTTAADTASQAEKEASSSAEETAQNSSADTASQPQDTSASQSADDKDESTGGKVLVAYFSNVQTDSTDADASASRLYRNGNMVGVTEYGAQIIAEHTGGDLFFIKGNDYPADYDSTTQVAREEQQDNARPQLADHIDNIDDYDVVFVCYPTWWTDMPMAVYSFFDEYDLSGKTIVPFNTHWGYGAADTYETIAQLEPDADVKEGLSVYNYDMESSETAITDWVDGLGII